MNPQSLNRYSYALNNPINNTDPSGHCVFAFPYDTALCAAAAALTVVAVDAAMPNVNILGDAAAGLAEIASIKTHNVGSGMKDLGEDAAQIQQAIKKAIAGPSPSGNPGDFDPNDDVNKRGPWKVGDPIDKLLSSGDEPSWSTIRSRYWKNRAATARPGEFSPQNIANMEKGYSPKARIIARMNETGEEVEMLVRRDLHHVGGRNLPGANSINNLKEVWPWEHAKIDNSRYVNYEFLRFK